MGPALVSPSKAVHAGVGEGRHVIRCWLHLWAPDAPPSFSLLPCLLYPPSSSPDPSPSTSSVSSGRVNPRDCGLKGSLSPPWGLAGVLNLLSPLSLECSELWDQTASGSNPLLLLSAGLATRFCDPGLRVSGRERQIQMPPRSW